MASSNNRNGNGASVMANAIVLLLLTLTGAGIGLAAGGMTAMQATGAAPGAPEASGKAEKPDGEESTPASDGKEQDEAEEPELPELERPEVKAYPFPPVLTSVAIPKGAWIRIEGTMLVDVNAEEKPEVLVEQAATSLLGYLRSVDLRQIEGASGLLYFQQDINEMVSALSGGQVREVLIHTLVVE